MTTDNEILDLVAANAGLHRNLQSNWHYTLMLDLANWEIISASDPDDKFGYDWDYFEDLYDNLIAVVNCKSTDDVHYYICEWNGNIWWEAHSGGETGSLD